MGTMMDALELQMRRREIMSRNLDYPVFMHEIRTFVKQDSTILSGFTPIKGRRKLSKKQRKNRRNKQ